MYRVKNQRGDTIIEVIISMTILAVVLMAAFLLANSSLRSGTNSGIRNQAVAYAGQQAEAIKNAAINSPATFNSYKRQINNGEFFCIDNTNTLQAHTLADLAGGSYPPDCVFDSEFAIVDFYSSSNETFTIKVRWIGSNTKVGDDTTVQEVVTYYQAPEVN